MKEKRKVGRPKLADSITKKKSLIMIFGALLLVIAIAINGYFLVFRNVKTVDLEGAVNNSQSTADKVYFLEQNGAASSIVIESNGHYGIIDVGVPDKTLVNNTDKTKKNKKYETKSLSSTQMNSACKSLYNDIKKITGNNKIDFVISTHIHKDHSYCLFANDSKDSKVNFFNNFNVDTLYIKPYKGYDEYGNGGSSTSTQMVRYNNTLKFAKNKGVVVTPTSKKTYKLGDFSFIFFNTTQRLDKTTWNAGSNYRKISENINSLAVLMLYKGNNKYYTTYFASDLENANIPSGGKYNYLKTKTGMHPLYVEAAIASTVKGFINSIKNNMKNQSNVIDLYYAAHHGYGSANQSNAIGTAQNDIQFNNAIVGNTLDNLCKKVQSYNYSKPNDYSQALNGIQRINTNIRRNNVSNGKIYFSGNNTVVANYSYNGIGISGFNGNSTYYISSSKYNWTNGNATFNSLCK